MTLKVSDNGRFLVQDGAPFFYLADTAWELFHRLSREEASEYLEDRAAKGFTVIQAVALAEHEFSRPNFYGDHPLHDNDPKRPNDAYFAHVNWIVDRAASLGLHIGLLPTWGDKWNQKWGAGPELFTPDNAAVYGEWLGRRYGDKPVIWILGGDRPVENETHFAIIRATAQGIKQGDGGRCLITFHPQGQETSAQYFHNDDWLDFHMYQTGHSRDRDNWRSIGEVYDLAPIKPVLDAEPGYEDHPNSFNADNGYLDDYDVRKSAYWALFAGACGHTYGCHDIWQFLNPERFTPVTTPRTPWREALQLPGAGQMQHARRLIESRPFLSRVPDQTLIVSDAREGTDHIQATRDSDGSYAFVYFASGQPATVDVRKLSGPTLRACWYDPRNGIASDAGEISNAAPQEFTPPSNSPGRDWVLILDNAACNYPAPGSCPHQETQA